MGVSPTQAIYVGDRRDVDAEAARRIGMHWIWLDRSGVGADSDPRSRIGSLSELPATLMLIEQTEAENGLKPISR